MSSDAPRCPRYVVTEKQVIDEVGVTRDLQAMVDAAESMGAIGLELGPGEWEIRTGEPLRLPAAFVLSGTLSRGGKPLTTIKAVTGDGAAKHFPAVIDGVGGATVKHFLFVDDRGGQGRGPTLRFRDGEAGARPRSIRGVGCEDWQQDG